MNKIDDNSFQTFSIGAFKWKTCSVNIKGVHEFDRYHLVRPLSSGKQFRRNTVWITQLLLLH